MANAKRENNRIPSALLWDSANSVVRPWKADSSTNRALLSIVDTSPPTPTPAGPPAKRDANRKPSVLVLVDGTDTLVPLMCDSNGYAVLDLTVE